MAAKKAIAVFVKTIGLSSVKTRLAEKIGKDSAEAFYKLSVNAIRETLSQLSDDIDIHWAVAEKEALNNPEWRDFKTIWQGEGGLGERLHNIYFSLLEREKYTQVTIIGSDSPQLTSAHLDLDIVDQADFAVGPACDGGFYLFAGSKKIDKGVWVNIPYSQENTLNSLCTQLKTIGSVILVDETFDVDTIKDLTVLQTHLLNYGKTQSQADLCRWLKDSLKLGAVID